MIIPDNIDVSIYPARIVETQFTGKAICWCRQSLDARPIDHYKGCAVFTQAKASETLYKTPPWVKSCPKS